jgi:hypothetical protein
MNTYCLIKSFQWPLKPNIITWRPALELPLLNYRFIFQVQNYQFMIKRWKWERLCVRTNFILVCLNFEDYCTYRCWCHPPWQYFNISTSPISWHDDRNPRNEQSIWVITHLPLHDNIPIFIHFQVHRATLTKCLLKWERLLKPANCCVWGRQWSQRGYQ